MITCPCGFVAAPGIAPESPQWHRDHRQAHLARYPAVDVGTRRSLDLLVELADRDAFAPPQAVLS